MNCVFEEYIKYVDNFLVNYFKLLLSSRYEKRLVKPFIDKYKDVRYYNKYVVKENDFTTRLNKELYNIAREVMEENPDKIDKIKNIFALFSYVMFIDGCTKYTDLNTLLKTLYTDENIKLEYSDNTKKELNDLVREYIGKKIDFFKIFESDEFYLKGKKYPNNILMVDVGQRCNVGKLYSEYAINKAYESELVVENRTYLGILMISSKILSEVLAYDFRSNYIINLPVSLLEKPKKIVKFLKALDDEMVRSKIHLKFTYKDYKKYKKEINSLINQDYSVCLELDETYDINFDNLFLFSFILISKKYKYYDIIMNNRDEVKTNIIEL